MQEIQLLSEKLDALLEKYESLKAENKRLKTTVAEQARSLESLNGKLATVEQQMVALQAGKSVVGDDQEKEAMRRQLDTVITEIDKILHTLND